MKAKAFSHRVISYGPGGFKCPCCGPSQKKRPQERRHLRRREQRLIEKIERIEQMKDE
jgi:hypothetical protein